MVPLAVGLYTILLPGMPSGPIIQPQGLTMMRTFDLRQGSGQGDVVSPDTTSAARAQDATTHTLPILHQNETWFTA